MNVTDILSEFGWHLHVYHAVTALAIVAAFACGLTLGRRIGHHEAEGHWRSVAEKWKRLAVKWLTRWIERWRAERARRERAEDRLNELKGAQKAYDDALRRTA